MKRFQDKVAIVTGAGRGLGAQYAKDLAEEGAVVALWDLNAANLDKAKQEIEAKGGRALTYTTNITNYAEVEKCVADIISQFGKIDILINNAAFHKSQPVAETSIEDWQKQIDTNLNGSFYCTKAVLPHMLSRKYGKILNIASAAAKVFFPGFAAYGASKAGLVNFTNILSEEVKLQNINVNSIYLGMTNTEYTRERMNKDAAVTIPLEEMMQPPEVSKVVLFLVSDEAAPIKGAAIDVFGNRY
ncbi:MAG: SDR family NAD(P)-dependent oxidoreductase [Anaerolineaceae bacterium]|nr:SDR family NAD(P)-dependent oxidoreductase [Anaerolineaceae bacterium]